ncbi:MAG: dCMP deaminase [Candidatus Harrisonbacteria bacterium]|nr:dCMP deaminase [Candidatus Harrisonbacteria bacterium]
MHEDPPRLSFLEYGSFLAYGASLRATCRRKIVGCALFKDKRVVATGYNGAPAGAPQCDEVGHLMVDGHCVRVTHAERNAVLFSGGRDLSGGYAFVTTRPCKDCFNLFLAVGIKNIYYLEDYRKEDTEEHVEMARKEQGVILEKIDSCVVRLLQKSLEFHQGPGGLLIARNKLTIEEYNPEMMDH